MPRIYVETAKNVDRIKFNDIFYRRYPDSPHKHLQRYYSRSGGRGFLHRDKWEFYRGPIPAGWQVHHKNGNHLDNRLANLECVPRAAHDAEHSEDRRAYGKSERQLQHLDTMRHKATAWHKSEAGRAWHAEHGKKSWEGRTRVGCTCQECGAAFESYFSDAQFCGKSCQNRNWHKKHPGYGATKRARRKAAGL